MNSVLTEIENRDAGESYFSGEDPLMFFQSTESLQSDNLGNTVFWEIQFSGKYSFLGNTVFWEIQFTETKKFGLLNLMAQLQEGFQSTGEMSNFQSCTRGNLNICSQKSFQCYTKCIKISGK